jgi:hypothetical protein
LYRSGYSSRYSQNKSKTGYIIVTAMVAAVVIAALAVAFFIFGEDPSPLPLTDGAVIDGGEEPNGVSKVTASTINIDATVEARVAQILAAQRTPNIDATVEARVRQKLAAQPTFMPQVIFKEIPLEIIKDVVREALAARVATTASPVSKPAFTPLPSAAPVATPTPPSTLAPTPVPTAMPTLVPTPVPTPIPTSVPTPLPTPMPTLVPTPVPTPIPTSVPTPTPIPGTKIGNVVLTQNTTWRKSESPFHLEGEVQVVKGVTLTIEPGVTIIGDGGWIAFSGTVIAEGTSSDKISFEMTTAGIFESQSKTGRLTVHHAVITGAGATDIFFGIGVYFVKTHLFGSGMTVEFHDSIFRGVEYLVYPGPATVIAERNIFRDSTRFRFTGNSSAIAAQYNCFNMPWPPVVVTITGTSSVNFNSIYGMTTPIPEEMYDNGFQAFGGSIDASENYWHGLSESDIRETISDSTVSSTKLGSVEILPLLTEPHPDAPDCS